MNALSKNLDLTFEGKVLRVVDQQGNPWFVLADICKALGLTNPSVVASELDEDEKATLSLSYTSSKQRRRVIIVSEPGALSIILRANGARTPGTFAYRFRRWVTHEVLPSIRQHGQYPPPPPLPSLEQPDDAHQPSLETSPTDRFMQECRRIAAERGYASVDEFGLLFMSKGKWSAMKRGDGVVSNLTKDWLKLRALASWGFDLPFILNGVYKITPQERAIVEQLRIEAEERRALPEA